MHYTQNMFKCEPYIPGKLESMNRERSAIRRQPDLQTLKNALPLISMTLILFGMQSRELWS